MMEIKNQQIFTCGEGEQKCEIYFTIDLIPILVIIKYDYIKTIIPYFNFDTNKMETSFTYSEPRLIQNIYCKESYQKIIDLACEKLNLEERAVLCLQDNSVINSFDFSKNEYFYEFQFSSNFGRSYYVKTKLHHALKYWDEFEKIRIVSDNDYYKLKNDDIDYGFFRQLNLLRKDLQLQGVFRNRDYHFISDKTMDNFISNLGTKSKRIKQSKLTT